jgi:hypothetical protein
MSTRSLTRQLAREGTTFGEILERLRRHLASRYLAHDRMSIKQIAWLLGYSEPGAFTHAYKRWTGITPRRARQKQAPGQVSARLRLQTMKSVAVDVLDVPISDQFQSLCIVAIPFCLEQSVSSYDAHHERNQIPGLLRLTPWDSGLEFVGKRQVISGFWLRLPLDRAARIGQLWRIHQGTALAGLPGVPALRHYRSGNSNAITSAIKS